MNRVNRDRDGLRSPSGSEAEGELVPGLWTFHGVQARTGHIPSAPSRKQVLLPSLKV